MMKNGSRGRAFAPLAFAALTACGGGSNTTSVRTISPADGTTTVSTHATIKIQLDGAIDPSSLPGHVQLLSTGFSLDVKLAYDEAAHVITVAPAQGPMQYDTAYRVSVAGLVDAGGHAVPEAQASFDTQIRSRLSTQASEDSSHSQATLDASGRMTRWTNYDDQGRVTSYQAIDRAGSRVTSWKTYTDPGPDGTWFTADDLLQERDDSTYDANGARTSMTVAYPQHTFLDFVDDLKEAFQYDSAGNVILTTVTSGGSNFVLGDDNDVTSWEQQTYDASGHFLGSIVSESAGPDGRLFTADDTIGRKVVVTPGAGDAPETTATYDGEGNLLFRSLDYRDAAGHVVRNVFDDSSIATLTHIANYTDFVNDARGLLLKSTFYSDPGPDGAWFTPDDIATEISERVRDVNGDIVSESQSLCDGLGSCSTWVSKYDTTR